MKNKHFFLLASLCVLTLTARIFTTDFYFHDDFRFWEGMSQPESIEGICNYYVALGRPLLSLWILLCDFIFQFTHTLLWQKFLVSLTTIATACLLFKVLSYQKYAEIPQDIRFFLSLSICVLPSFYTAGIWIIASGVPLATLFALAANICMDRSRNNPATRRQFIYATLILLLFSYITYQTAAAIFMIPYILLAIQKYCKEKNTNALKVLLEP